MKEIRLHGRGGQGVVKAAQLIVKTIVNQGGFAHFIPFFGVERKGSPVYGFLRIDDKPIRLKTQVYEPHCLVIMDDTLLDSVPVFEGLRQDGTVVINSCKDFDVFAAHQNVKKIGIVDATSIAAEKIGKNMPPNTAVLGALAKTTGFINWDALQREIEKTFGVTNLSAAQQAFETTAVHII
ncbi:NADH-dependent phenylglyoxylate dehydrogenase subunit gamma [Sporomusa silvacetica DSM 10669]|uniref:NADH-dependent phenylglyoxylate dehydrogenase subunit gamma n=1 Tax=Sporomusa silvacetica DSM 10669 TaxID=1123289 RepID=A0ABZ3IUZ6_9FIRM|nr:2-oxoacid:acceptor oxidoreductase family protein [Sporomusa silvacetica]OZC14267.1 NADH-dependent phenylglyoxylate dehydrogenase subunit gamma [Sporomusa silvacetica DSM 10669]